MRGLNVLPTRHLLPSSLGTPTPAPRALSLQFRSRDLTTRMLTQPLINAIRSSGRFLWRARHARFGALGAQIGPNRPKSSVTRTP